VIAVGVAAAEAGDPAFPLQHAISYSIAHTLPTCTSSSHAQLHPPNTHPCAPCRWEANSARVWGADAPTLSQTRVHAKCLRSVPLVREYFRKYRARKRGDPVVSRLSPTIVSAWLLVLCVRLSLGPACCHACCCMERRGCLYAHAHSRMPLPYPHPLQEEGDEAATTTGGSGATTSDADGSPAPEEGAKPSKRHRTSNGAPDKPQHPQAADQAATAMPMLYPLTPEMAAAAAAGGVPHWPGAAGMGLGGPYPTGLPMPMCLPLPPGIQMSAEEQQPQKLTVEQLSTQLLLQQHALLHELLQRQLQQQAAPAGAGAGGVDDTSQPLMMWNLPPGMQQEKGQQDQQPCQQQQQSPSKQPKQQQQQREPAEQPQEAAAAAAAVALPEKRRPLQPAAAAKRPSVCDDQPRDVDVRCAVSDQGVEVGDFSIVAGA